MAPTTILLLRHAEHDLVGRALASRVPGVCLNARGEAEAAALALALDRFPLAAIYASPRERAQQTAAPLAARRHLPILLSAASDDINFGAWSGRTFTELTADPEWPVWCTRRTAAHPPGGETIGEVRTRIVLELEHLAAKHPGRTIALFSHCDVIKCALAHHLNLSLDDLERFEISPASLSTLLLAGPWSKVTSLNQPLS